MRGNNLTFEETIVAIFGLKETEEMREKSKKEAEAQNNRWKKELEEIMESFEEDDIIEVEEVSTMKHKVLMDTVAFNKKPTSRQIGAIQNRLPELVKEMTIEEIANELTSGKTFKPNYMTGRSQESFVSSTLIAIDIDNKGKELEEHGYVSIEKFLELSSKSKLKPAIVYTTFSHTDVCHKYRAIFQIGRVITNLDELKAIGDKLKAEYPYADAKVSPVHPIYGGKQLIKLDEKATINPVVEVNNMKATVRVKGKETTITKVVEEKKVLTKEMLIANLETLTEQFEGIVVDVANSFEWINENVPMTVALGFDVNTRFRCILPDHKDTKPSARISETIDGRQNYICSCQNTYTSLIDVIALALDMNKVLVQYLIAETIGISIGSDYQKSMRLLIVDMMANTKRIIKEDSVLYKFMKRSNLLGTYNLIQQFAQRHITMKPLGASDKITFFMSQSQIKSEMEDFAMRGAGTIGYKLNTLKELGLIRALRDDEISQEALSTAQKIQKEMKLKSNNKNLNRVEFYELCILTPSKIKKAESTIIALKEAGVKRRHNNVVRRAAALGQEFAEMVNVQVNVQQKLNDPKRQKKLYKMTKVAKTLLDNQGYFTEEQLRKAFDPKRKQTKATTQKMIDDFIPHIIRELDIKKDRVKKSTRTKHSIPSDIKNNTTIYC